MSAVSEFLEWLRPGGPWVLTAIIPDGKTNTITATTAAAVDTFVAKYDGKRDLYYSLNPTHGPMTSKASKQDISAGEFVHADLDPRDDETPEQAKARYLAALESFEPKSSAVVDSGNGLQAVWRQVEPSTVFDDVEAASLAATLALGGPRGTQNIDRILRLPGTTNLPNKKKRRDGRVVCPTKLLWANDAICRLSDFPKEEQAKPSPDSKQGVALDWSKVKEHSGWLKGVESLPRDFNTKGRMIVASVNLKELNHDLQEAGRLDKSYGSWSAASMALAAIFKADPRFTREQIAAALLCPLPCNQHINRQPDKRRAVERALKYSYEPSQRVAHVLKWRECYEDGRPRASMHNAELAITALGVVCSHDTFHNKILFGYRGDDQRHELGSLVGEVTDNGIIRVRKLMSDRFGFDLEDRHTRDAVISLAEDNRFDPVLDMLAEAQGKWDGKERLDSMAVAYFNCEDTPLNRAILRIAMIAAVRRVRQPGCKFDTIVVLESKEGWNKSSAWRVLAGDENFSDASILGRGGREVQEHLAHVLIHESADLHGMRKADVEHIKSFASRQFDSARPAYGRFLINQARHSIEVATTNNNEYLQSQTGNRRFWPMIVLKMIDLDKLKRDRLQLWGEAAACEAAGESIVLNESLWPAAEVEQEMRRTKDPWEDVLVNIPDEVIRFDETVPIIIREYDRERVASADLLTHVLNLPIDRQQTGHTMRLSDVMTRLGWVRDKIFLKDSNKQVRGYCRPLGGEVAAQEEPVGDDPPFFDDDRI